MERLPSDLESLPDGKLLELDVHYEREARFALEALRAVRSVRAARHEHEDLPDNVIPFPAARMRLVPDPAC